MKGVFITFEGPEGGGKSTQIKRLARRLIGLHRKVLVTREPGGTPAGEAIRNVLQHDPAGEAICSEAETLLFEASRAQLARSVIVPALRRGLCVICDRFTDSTLAYQGYGRGLDRRTIRTINSFAANGATPDITILLDVDVKLGLKRLHGRNSRRGACRDRIEREALAFHRRVRAGYIEMARKEPKRFAVIDAGRDADVVEMKVWNVVRGVVGRETRRSK